MPYKNRNAGGSTYEMARKRRKSMLIMAIVGVAIFAVILLVFNNTKALGIGGIGFLILLLIIQAFPDMLDKVLTKKQKEVRRAEKGFDAEVQVDSLMENLSEDFCVLNDLASPYGNIDHVIISKNGGLFLIETKSHHGKVTINENVLYLNGHLPEKDFIAQTLKNAYWLRDRVFELAGVKAWIYPIIVFTNAFVPFSNPVKGIKVINQKYLLPTLKNTASQNSTNQTLWAKKHLIIAGLDK